MKSFRNFLILVLLVLTGIWFYRRHEEKKKQQKELEEKLAKEREEARQKLFDFYKTKLDSIDIANNKFAKLLDLNTGYFTNYQLTVWKSQQSNLFNEIKGKPIEKIQLSDKEVKSIVAFTDYFNNAEKLRYDFNKVFIKEELKKYSTFFCNIEGKELDLQQRTAIVTDEDNNIVIAGAGSGKTLTIIGKIKYIMHRYNISAEEILLISFTRKSANDLATRIQAEGINGITAKTFNAFGLQVILNVNNGNEQVNVFGNNANENAGINNFKILLQAIFNELINNTTYLTKVTDYFNDYLKEPKSQFEFENRGEYIQYLKDQNYRPYKHEIRGQYMMRPIVKSIEECKIANFLFFNGIDYKYEAPYEINMTDINHVQYCPDFSIYQNGRRIYLEHYGINREGTVPDWFANDGNITANESYKESMEWKEQTHINNNTTLIKTFSYEMFEGTLYNNLTQRLIENGIILHPKTPQEIWQIIKESAMEEVKDFIDLFETFINLTKSNNYSIIDIIEKNEYIKDKFQRKRNALFIEIIKPIFERYQNHLTSANQIDFSDMINKSVYHILQKDYKSKFSYVLIDEFQDISKGRYQLVKAIKTNNPACKLFCVGDDWQSIYRFSGSDCTYYTQLMIMEAHQAEEYF
jgi:DNA helicase-4